MGFLSNKVKRHELNAGDHIYTYRSAYIYAHHGIYVGNNTVIHFLSCLSTSSFSAMSISSLGSGSKCTIIPNCGHKNPDCTSAVVSSCLDCFLKKGTIYRFAYGVRKTVAFTRVRGGSCTRDSADPPEKTIHRANYLLRTGFGDYHLDARNCENFASYCKTAFVYVSEGSDDLLTLTADRIKGLGRYCGQLYSGILNYTVASPIIAAVVVASVVDTIKGNEIAYEEPEKKLKVEVEDLASIFQWVSTAEK